MTRGDRSSTAGLDRPSSDVVRQPPPSRRTEHLLTHLKVTRSSRGAPRTRPNRVRADKAYSSRAIRTQLRRCGITAVIPEPSDQIAHRKRPRSHGRRPPAFDAADYKGRNVIERGFNNAKQWRGLATPLRQTRHRLPRRSSAQSNHPLAHISQTCPRSNPDLYGLPAACLLDIRLNGRLAY